MKKRAVVASVSILLAGYIGIGAILFWGARTVPRPIHCSDTDEYDLVLDSYRLTLRESLSEGYAAIKSMIR